MSSGESRGRDRTSRRRHRSRASKERKKRKHTRPRSSNPRSPTDSPRKKKKKRRKKLSPYDHKEKEMKRSSSYDDKGKESRQEMDRRRKSDEYGDQKYFDTFTRHGGEPTIHPDRAALMPKHQYEDRERSRGVPTIHPDRLALVPQQQQCYEPSYDKGKEPKKSIRDHKPHVPELDRALGDTRPLPPSPPKPRDDIPLSIQNAFNQLDPKPPAPNGQLEIAVDEFGRPVEAEEPIEKEKPCFEPSGALDEPDKVIKRGVEIEYREPSNAKMPKEKWVWFVYKDEEQVREIWLHRKSYHLVGRCRKSCDVKLMHCTVSKHHCVLQYRERCLKGIWGVYPYIMDLGSRHGTYLNKQKLIPRKYYQLLSKDIIGFGRSSRKYIMIARGLINYHDIEIEKSASEGSPSSEEVANDGLDW